MKGSKSILVYLASLLAIVFVVGVGLKLYMEVVGPTSEKPQLIYTLSPNKTDLKVGDKVSVPLYLTGADASRVSAFDVKMYYDTAKFKLTKVTPGGFFSKYLTVKWEEKNNWFALAMTPGDPKMPADPSLPLLTLELTAIGSSSSTPVSTVASQVYLTQTGGFHPQMGTVSFTIN